MSKNGKAKLNIFRDYILPTSTINPQKTNQLPLQLQKFIKNKPPDRHREATFNLT
jgi:hypothetical protein